MVSLLDLPNAIRESIFSLAIVESTKSVPDLLLVSRQIYQESRAYMYNRPLTFESQQDLFIWLDKIGSSDLLNVDALSFCVKLETSQTPDFDGNSDHIEAGVENELKLLQSALRKLPNVTTLAVYKHLSDDRPEYLRLYNRILQSLSNLYPRLKSLAAHTDSLTLDFLRHLPLIERLQFTGFSESSPMETEAILSHLRHLKDIELIPSLRPPGFQPSSSRRNTLKPSLSRDVLRNLRIKSLDINESQKINRSAPAFWTPSFLGILPALNRHSLTRFGVVLDDFAPDANCVHMFCDFLRQSHLRDLTVEWESAADIVSRILEALPRSLNSLRLGRTVGDETVLTVLNELSSRKEAGRFPNLQELVIVQERGSNKSVSLSHLSSSSNTNFWQAELAGSIQDSSRNLEQQAVKIYLL